MVAVLEAWEPAQGRKHMARDVPTTGHCFSFYPTKASTFQFHMDRKQALEFATVLLAAMQKPKPTIRVWVKCTQESTAGVFPIQVHAVDSPKRKPRSK
jgi:hypothetical protein